jgi:ATP-binding cassette, subfamily C (CFTR/MRP), member 5
LFWTFFKFLPFSFIIPLSPSFSQKISLSRRFLTFEKSPGHSLSLSLSPLCSLVSFLTHSHTPSRLLYVSVILSVTHSLSLSLSLTLFHTLSYSLSRSLSHTYTLSLTLSLSLSLACSYALSHSLI